MFWDFAGAVTRRAYLCAFALCAIAAVFVPAPAAAAGAPQIGAAWTTDVTATSARLHAEVNPLGSPTGYRFEYLAAAAYEANLAAGVAGFAGASRVPPADLALGSGASMVSSSLQLSGLKAETGYRYRLVATNADGTTLGAPLAFVTRGAGGPLRLPDGRGWEMVSPVGKNGGEVQGLGVAGNLLQAAAQGGAVGFGSTSSFGEGAQGTPAISQYLSWRGGSGWATQNLSVPLLSGGYGDGPGENPYRLFAPDLGSALLANGQRCRGAAGECPVANPPLPGSGAPPGYRNYYRRDNSSGANRALLGPAVVGGLAPERFELGFAGAAPDLRHIVLSTCAALTPAATEVPAGAGCDPAATNLYEWSQAGDLSLVNRLPGALVGTPGATLAAPGGAVSEDGSRVYWALGDDLYLYERGAPTAQVDAAVGGGGDFQAAAADGSLAFFTKAGHLYRYDAGTAAATDLTPAGGVEGVLGVSADGAYVYYVAGALFVHRQGAAVQIAAAADPGNYPPATGTARVSADGTRLAFLSEASLTGYDNLDQDGSGPVSEVFFYSADPSGGGTLRCASCNPTGARPLGPSTLPGAVGGGEGTDAVPAYKPRALSGDGRRLFFDSADALVSQDTNNRPDVYEWEAQGAGDCSRPGGCLNLISSGRGGEGASFADASGNGDDVFFLTDGSLVSGDPGSVDLYDARVGGGFPLPPTPIPCDGDACQPLPSPPDDPLPGTLATSAGNPPLTIEKAARKTKKAKAKRAKKRKDGRRGRQAQRTRAGGGR